MRNRICVGLGVVFVLTVGVNAAIGVGATNYKVTKVGSEEEQSFSILLGGKSVTEAPAGDWLTVDPIVPEGKMFKSFTVYKEYGEKVEEQKEASVDRNEMRFLMPDYDVFVKSSFESLRYYINTKESANGSIAVSFSDRMDVKDRTKPTFKVTVTPTAAEGYKLASIKVTKYLDSNTTVTCTKTEAAVGGIGGGFGGGFGGWPGMGPTVTEGSCVFEMPTFDVDVSATFVKDAEVVPAVDYKDKKFDVTYELNGGTLPAEAAKSFLCDSIAKLPTPTKDGFDFVGWSLENKLDNVYHALDRLDGHICKKTTVYAIWTAKGSCPEQTAIEVDSAVIRFPVCAPTIKCALLYSKATKQDSVCNGVVWTSDKALLPSSSSAAPVSSSSVVESSSSVEPSSSSVLVSSSSIPESSSSAPISSSSNPASSSSIPVSSSSNVPSSSSAPVPPESSSSVVVSSSSAVQNAYYKITKVGSKENQSFNLVLNGNVITEAKQGDWPEISPIAPEGKKYKSWTLYDEYGETPESQKERTTGKLGMRFLMPDHQVYVMVTYEADVASSSAVASSSSAKPASSSVVPVSSSSVKPASSSSAKPASSSAKVSSSSAKPASSSAKASSSSAKPASSSAKSSSSVVVESVKTEEDLPNCTDKRENITYYVSNLKAVFICKNKKWTKFDPNGLPVVAKVAKFSVVANGRSLQISGAKIGSQVSLFDMQGRVIYNGRVDAANFSLNVPRVGSFLLRIGSQQKVVNIR